MRLARRSAEPRRTRQPASALVGVVEPGEYSLPAITPDEQSFVAVYELLFHRLTDFAARYLGLDDAKDAVQDAMLNMWSRWKVVLLDRPGVAFFFRAVRNQMAFARRTARRAEDLEAQYAYLSAEPSTTRPADAHIESEELAGVIERGVAHMPERCREVWSLVHEQEFTYKQAAESLELTQTTVRRHMSRAQSFLREALTDAGYHEAALLTAKQLHALPPATAAEDEHND
jgi:RNA polymerase sigma factor (sigma-70 family)